MRLVNTLSLSIANFCIGSAFALLPSAAIFPLYIYPGDCSPWSAVKSTIQTDSIVQYYIVVNPASGPGGPPGSQPDANYQACIADLRAAGSSFENVKILGYVATGFGARSSSSVTSDIDTYSQWSSSYRPDGIFFDEAATSTSFLPAYQSFASRVRSDFTSSFVVLNPGTKPETENYFNIADLIVTFEGNYADFDPSSSLTVTPSSPSRKQAVLLHDGPSQLTSSYVDELASILDVGASFITDFPNADAYENIPSSWFFFCEALIGAQTA